MAQKTPAKVRESLIAQLRAKGADIAHFEALIDDYVEYFKIVKECKKDLKERGLTYEAVSAAGKKYEKENPSAKLLPQYTRAMLSILKELGLTTDNIAEEDEEL